MPRFFFFPFPSPNGAEEGGFGDQKAHMYVRFVKYVK